MAKKRWNLTEMIECKMDTCAYNDAWDCMLKKMHIGADGVCADYRKRA